MRSTALSVLCVLAFSACAAQPRAVRESDDAEVRAELAAVADAFSRAYMAGDVDTIVSLYTEDAVLIPHGGTEVRGLDAIEAFWAPREGVTIAHHKITSAQVEVFGDVATDYGTYVARGSAGGQTWGPSHGNYLIVWKRGTDGQWRMQLDMWNGRPAPDDARRHSAP